jgi:hypothetical protein
MVDESLKSSKWHNAGRTRLCRIFAWRSWKKMAQSTARGPGLASRLEGWGRKASRLVVTASRRGRELQEER